ncbi:MAG: hypothetical protein RTV41_07210 [Candidatus Thorarchaeota archaeon]
MDEQTLLKYLEVTEELGIESTEWYNLITIYKKKGENPKNSGS